MVYFVTSAVGGSILRGRKASVLCKAGAKLHRGDVFGRIVVRGT